MPRNIEEPVLMKVNYPTLNRNISKFSLPHIWHRVLHNTPGLNLKRHVWVVGHVKSNTPYQIISTSPQIK